MSSSSTSSFTIFFEDWLTKQESFLQQLEQVCLSSDHQQCAEIIPRVFSHYQTFYEEKYKATNDDVFLFLSPPWLSSFEITMLWISGFRPSLLFTILTNTFSNDNLSDDQRYKIDITKSETRQKEKEITKAMARVQESIAEPPMYGLIRSFGKLVDGEVGELDRAMEELKNTMVGVVRRADDLRWTTAGKVVEILDPIQNVKFLAALTRFQIQARKRGVERDNARTT